MNNVTIVYNDEHHGVEVYFSTMPELSIRELLKSNRFRYHSKKRCWYAFRNDETIKIAQSLVS